MVSHNPRQGADSGEGGVSMVSHNPIICIFVKTSCQYCHDEETLSLISDHVRYTSIYGGQVLEQARLKNRSCAFACWPLAHPQLVSWEWWVWVVGSGTCPVTGRWAATRLTFPTTGSRWANLLVNSFPALFIPRTKISSYFLDKEARNRTCENATCQATPQSTKRFTYKTSHH